ncbi:hypothetical protein JZ751_020061 [Albula glossodonta]|uniref:Uncharacterized protein n=1 Tax=Albula glossodonta TaxID=121402 RepID=A0A8T2NTL6_9TELE|nr:hypothetical protein JZ751_020061 [Albula glossodonta]
MVVSMSVDSSSPTNIQEENESLDMPTNAPPDSEKMEMAPLPADAEVPRSSSPSPPTPLPPDGTGEDQSNDLSSHGKPAKDPVNDQESTEQTVSSVESPEPEHKVSAGSDLSQPVEQTGVLEESASALDENKENNNTGMCPTPEIPAPSAPSPKPLTQDAETHTSDPQSSEASDPQSSEAPEAQKGMAEKAASDGVASTVEDVPAQPNHQPPEHQKAASFSEPPKLRRDMATSTEELPLFEAPPPLPQASKSPPIYVLDSAPKPKPSNELTREYIPKVGLTTYTIVPQKSLEKLRYFEVELTLEAPDPAAQQEAAAKATNTEHSRIAVTATQPELLSPQPRAVPQLSNGMVTSNDACHGNLPPALPATLLADREDSKALTPYDAGIRAAPAPEAKEKKIPPATKPKPASFRLPLHKRTPGGYVTSAAVKSVNASHVSGHSEVPGRPGVEQPVETLEENSFPPPPPPVQWTEDEAAESSKDEQKPQEQSVADIHPLSLDSPPTSKLDCPVPSVIGPNPSVISPTESVLAPAPPVDGPTPRLTRQWSLPAKDSAGLSLEKLRSFAAPRPYMSTSQSRFAQAVSSALKRSQSLTQASGIEPQPRRTLPKPLLASHCTITEVVEPSRSSEREAQERQEGKAQALQREEQPDCGADSGTHSKTPSASDQGEIQDIYGDDTDHHVTGETDLPTVPEAFPPLSLNGGPSEMQSAQVE